MKIPARLNVKRSKRLREDLTGNSSFPGMTVNIVGGGSHYARCTAAVSIGKSGFYHPGEAVIRAITQQAEYDEQTGVARLLNKEKVNCSQPATLPNHHSKVHAHSAMKRVPRLFLRMWIGPRDSQGRSGWFFAYTDKVLYVTWNPQDGWKHVVVPPDGIMR